MTQSDVNVFTKVEKVQTVQSEANKNKIDESTEVYMPKIVWINVIFFIFLHAIVPYSFYLLFTENLWRILYFQVTIGFLGGLGVTAGAHRLWSHESYKAKLPLRIFLAFWFIVAGQNDLYEWCRDHRAHHKFSETNADPHNSHRGFFFAHMGWLLVNKHPEVKRKGSTIDLSDLLADPVVQFQKKYYPWLMVVCSFVIPTLLGMHFFEVCWLYSLCGCLTRYCISLHITWLINSAAHMYGYRPYNNHIRPAESWPVTYVNLLGEGYHNYHHTFPQDYKASEYGYFFQCNLTALFIDIMALIGQVYDRKSASPSLIEACKQNVLKSKKA